MFGDLFDDNFLFDHDASITKFIIEASSKGKIKVPGEGLSLSYPITFEDTVKLIIRASYIKVPQKIILLFYKNPITDISLAHIFQKIDPEINVDFIKEYRDQNLFIPEGAEYAISNYNIKNKLSDINLNEPKKIIPSKKKKPKHKFSIFKPFLFLILIFFFLILLPFSTMQIYGYLGENEIKNSFNLIKEDNFEDALKKSERAETYFNISENIANLTSRQLAFINKQNIVAEVILKDEAGKAISNSMQNLSKGMIAIENVYQGKSINQEEEFLKGIEYVRISNSEIQKLERLGKNLRWFNKQDVDLYKNANMFLDASDILPTFLGLDNEKNYLILFEDNNELRPSGGRIKTAAELTIKDLKIQNFKVVDVKELDEKLNVHVEPPFPVRRYLPTKNYFLEDAGFDPDFVESAITASTIYNLESGEEIDGVIAVDLYFLKSILKEVGPVYLEDIGKNVTDENLFQIASEFNEKADEDNFTSKLLEKILFTINQSDGIKLYTLLNIIGNSIQQKHMLFAYRDADIQSVLSANNFSSSLVDNRLNKNNKINDYFGLSEANLGKNKINLYISRSISKKNIINTNGSLSSEVTIAFKNNSQRGSSFSKTYKNYIQVILPEGVKLNNVLLNGIKQDIIPAIKNYETYEDKRFEVPSDMEIDQRTESNKNIFGFLINVEPDSIETIKINYDTPFVILTNPSTPTDYSLFIYKQPGIDSIPFNLTYEQKGNFVILPEDSYSMDIKKDEIIQSTISKK